MKYIAVFFLIPLFFFVGCSKNNPTEPSVLSDSQLKSKIVGTWENEYLTIVYNENNNFQETIHFVAQDSTFGQSEIIKGTYTIKDGILFYNINDWEIVDTSAYPNGLFSSIPEFKIKIEGDKLSFYPLFVLTRLSGNDNDIWGEWITTFWSMAYRTGHSPALLEEQTIFKFIEDSLTVYYGTSAAGEPIDSVQYTSAKIQYNPPNLSWSPNYNKIIEFHNAQMYMFEHLNSTQLPLTKVK